MKSRSLTILSRTVQGLLLSAIVASATLHAGTIHGGLGLFGGSRWDAAPRTINGNERSLDGGLRFSLEGGSYEAFRDMFSWTSVPSVDSFQLAVEEAFAAWESVDITTGLGTDIRFVADLGTQVVGSGSYDGFDLNGAEIDLFAADAGDDHLKALTNFFPAISPVTLTSGVANYQGSTAIAGVDIKLNNNSGALYTLDIFRRSLTHEIGHAIGLGDLESASSSAQFIDDNYNGATSATALATLTNSWANLVNVYNPAASPLHVYTLPNANPGIKTPGVNLLMESNGTGISAGNPVTNLVPLTNDEYGTRQFLYPMVAVPEPSLWALLVLGGVGLLWRNRRTGSSPRRA